MRAHMTSRGRLTIPKPLRDLIGLGPGSEVDFTEENGEIYLRPRDPEVRKRIAALNEVLRRRREANL